MMDYQFDGRISKEVLENYLSRAVTAAGLYESETLSDDLRVIRELGVKFLGRASGIWYMTEDDDVHFAKSRELAEKVHEADSEIILQACIFECVTQRMESVKIPEFVFRDFGMEPKDRCFCLADTLFPGEPAGFVSRREEPEKNGGIPDLNRQEARMWKYWNSIIICYSNNII